MRLLSQKPEIGLWRDSDEQRHDDLAEDTPEQRAAFA
jgi:hypothetical protein